MLLFLTADRTWHMGYGAWSLFFAPKVVEGILSIAMRFPYNLNPFQRYKEVIDYLNKHEACAWRIVVSQATEHVTHYERAPRLR